MKKIFIFLISFILIFSMVGCTNSISSNKDISVMKLETDQNIFDLVKHIEELDCKYYNFKLNYKEYSNELETLNKHLSSIIVNTYEDLEKFHFNRCPISNLKLPSDSETYEDLYNLESKFLEENTIQPWIFEKSEISDVYHNSDTNFKYIYTKVYWKFTSEDLDPISRRYQYLLKKYEFVEEDGEWKLVSVDWQDELLVRRNKSKEPRLSLFNGELVKYSETIKH